MRAISVEKFSVSRGIWVATGEYIQERSHLAVESVRRNLVEKMFVEHMKDSVPRRPKLTTQQPHSFKNK